MCCGIDEDQPEFGLIVDCIVTEKEETLFVVAQLEIVCWDEHYHSWNIAITNTLAIITPQKLADHHPLHLINISGKIFVCLKYHIINK